MATFKAYIKDGELLVKSRLGKSESINTNELQVFQTKLVRGIMRPTPESENKITYSAPAGLSLKEYMSGGITINDFFVVIAQIVEMTKKVESTALNISNIVMDISNVYINTMTKEVYFIYQPIFNVELRSNIFKLLFDISGISFFNQGENLNSINGFVNELMQIQYYQPSQVENVIMQIYPNVYKQVKRQAGGKSQIFNETVAKPYDTGYGVSSSMNTGNQAGMMTGGNMSVPFMAIQNNNIDNEGTMLLDEGGTALLGEEDDYESQATTLLNVNIPTNPYIIRRMTYERADIDKPIFKIGKEKRFVDFFVTGNTAVSRVHADIITKNGQYFIRDNNSTNKTYVNRSPVPVNMEVQITDGDIIMLANDEFEFHIG